ncbi:hypothetical protein GN956_G12702 [Arapaima gigas]
MSVTEMAPAATSWQHPAQILFPEIVEDSEIMMAEEYMQVPDFYVPVKSKIHPASKRLEVDSLDRRRMLQVFRKAYRYLRAALFRVLNHCTAALKALQPVVFPCHKMANAPCVVNMASVVLYNPKQKCWEEELGCRFTGGMWAPVMPQEIEGAVCGPDEKIVEEEEDRVSASDKNLDNSMKEAVMEELEVDLSDWLEEDTSEEDPEVEELCSDVPLAALPKPPLSCLEKSSGPSPTTLPSEGEVEWDSDSSWDDEEDDEEWDEESESNSQLWESFLCNSDPYNPFRCSSITAVNDKPRKTPESCAQRPPQMSGRRAGVGRAEECHLVAEDGKTAVGNKKVRFSDVVKVHPLVTWRFASRAARDGSCWQEMARDRARFKRRVEAAGEVLSPCLQPEHRARVWRMLQLV